MNPEFTISSLSLPVRLTPETPMSDEAFLRFSAENDSLRMEREPNGDILIMAPAGTKSGMMNQRIGRLLDEWAESDGGGYAFDSSTGFKLSNGAVRSPDASWVSRDRWEALSEAEQEGFAPMCPEFVVELISPKDRLPSVRKKMLEWMANGTEVAWLIDPKRLVEVYRRGEAPEVHENPTSVQGTGGVSGFCLVMRRVWG
jgi:Uma2 family endonuclease